MFSQFPNEKSKTVPNWAEYDRMTDSRLMNPLYQRIYTLVSQIPYGKVTTYGNIAKRLGTTPRIVGFAMARLPRNHDIPWQRVINRQGKVSHRVDGDGHTLQRDLLESEGIIFNSKGQVDLNKFNWEGP